MLGEAELRGIERLEVRLDRRIREPAEVVVEGLLGCDAPGERVGEARRVLQGLRPAVERPHLKARHALDDLPRVQREVARAAVVARHEQEHPLGALAPELGDEDLVVLRRAGSGAPAIAVTVSAAAAGPASMTARTSPISPDRMAAQPTMGVVAVLIASDLSKDMAGEPLLRGVSFKLERRERMTIAGRNGAGKTTLLRMLSGETSIDGGELVLAKGTRVALHDQRPPRERDLSLRDYVLSGSREPIELEAELQRLEHAMAAGDEQAMNRYAGVQARFEAVGGYGWRERARSVVHGLGFVDDDLDRALRTFSGGQLTRASLARALAAHPDLLLLDEPTNHLDIESLEWLEQTLLDLDAAIVLVAHDRWFLETVGTSVLELEAGRGRFFNGTWHASRREQAARELSQLASLSAPGDLFWI